MRLIDADALLEKLGGIPLAWEYGQAVSDIYEMVKKEPIVKPKLGKWVEDDHILVCSECEGVAMQRVYYSLTHNATDIPMVKTPYCPHCGAKMEKGD